MTTMTQSSLTTPHGEDSPLLGKTRRRTACRLCEGAEFRLVVPMQPAPIGDAFVAEARSAIAQPLYPLDLYLCMTCGHAQSLDIVNPAELFGDYTYRTSISLGLIAHFQTYAQQICERAGVHDGDFVVEIGSNDGSLLKAFAARGLRVTGVDPAAAIAEEATNSGIPTIADFFTHDIAEEILGDRGPAKVICANNVFAHVDDLDTLTAGVATLLAYDGIFVFEVGYVLDMLDNFAVDAMYHEQVSHHALSPLVDFFAKHGLHMFDVERVQTKGGSIRVFVQHKETGRFSISPALQEALTAERERQITEPPIFAEFVARSEVAKRKTLEILDRVRAQGGTIAGYGASTTTTTLLYHFQLGGRIDFLVDDNPAKFGKLSPGLHLPVYPSTQLRDAAPTLTVVLAWMYERPIVTKNNAYLQAGGRFLVPLPQPREIHKASV